MSKSMERSAKSYLLNKMLDDFEYETQEYVKKILTKYGDVDFLLEYPEAMKKYRDHMDSSLLTFRKTGIELIETLAKECGLKKKKKEDDI